MTILHYLIIEDINVFILFYHHLKCQHLVNTLIFTLTLNKSLTTPPLSLSSQHNKITPNSQLDIYKNYSNPSHPITSLIY